MTPTTELQGEINKSTMTARITKNLSNNCIKQLEQIGFYGTLPTNTAEHTQHILLDHILSFKADLKIIQRKILSAFSGHKGSKLEISNRKLYRNTQIIGNFKTYFSIMHGNGKEIFKLLK